MVGLALGGYPVLNPVFAGNEDLQPLPFAVFFVLPLSLSSILRRQNVVVIVGYLCSFVWQFCLGDSSPSWRSFSISLALRQKSFL